MGDIPRGAKDREAALWGHPELGQNRAGAKLLQLHKYICVCIYIYVFIFGFFGFFFLPLLVNHRRFGTDLTPWVRVRLEYDNPIFLLDATCAFTAGMLAG